MVAHQTVPVNDPPLPLAHRAEKLEPTLPVGLAPKHAAPLVPPRHHVVHPARVLNTLVATNPGSRFIHLCAEQFLKDSRNSGYAAVLIIHEELHVLGLAENPPTSREITLRVISRCGAANAAPKS
jgi:hypothetical protein